MHVLIVGGGGREAALAWALARSPHIETLSCAPGNAGIANHAACVPIAADDVDGILRFVSERSVGLVVVGPEAPLVAGLADRLGERGVAVFGPEAEAARIEGSKAFSKELMQRHDIPTAAFEIFDDAARARTYLKDPAIGYPLVVKADGLAAGKGVVLCDGPREALDAADSMLTGGRFGEAGRRIVVEECLTGREASFFVLSDGKRWVELATCQDYKRIGDGDTGPNTGGMGTYSPSAHLDEPMRRRIAAELVEPTIRGLAAEGRPYRGVLYVGVMLTEDGPKVLEYNARFGDPEAQVLLPRLDGDWFEVLDACARSRLDEVDLVWTPRASVCVVLAAEGYPGSYAKGHVIEGLEDAAALEDVLVFHAGTAHDERGAVVNTGGRVLGVTALGDDVAAARQRAYEAADRIHWPGVQRRRDIALDAVERLQGRER